jgi:Ser/Thr protein kinase RdoA (MazF antagonist)
MKQLPAFTTHLADHYAVGAYSLHAIEDSPSDDRWLARLDQPDKPPLLVRAYRSAQPVPDWLSGCGTDHTPTWLTERAEILHLLQQWHYPAPRVIPTTSGALIATIDDWTLMLTSYISGQVRNPTPELLYRLGALLGQLHQISIHAGSAALVSAGRSWLHRERAIPRAQAHYSAAEVDVPLSWQALYAALPTVLTRLAQCGDLPVTIVHGDAWAGNTIEMVDGSCVLIDWELAGQGLAVTDLARLLLFCHEEVDPPSDGWLHPMAERVQAVIDGYCQQRVPNRAEQAVLLDAMRYGVALEAAGMFTWAQQRAWDTEMQAALDVRQHWYTICAEIARWAQERLRAHTERYDF